MSENKGFANKFGSQRLNTICFIIGVISFTAVTISMFVIMPIVME